MAAKARVDVTFDDEHVESFNPNRPRLLLDMENRFGVQQPERHEHIVWLAHHALVTLKGGGLPLDDWTNTVEDIDTIDLSEQEKGDGDPSGEAARSSTT